MIKKYKLVGIAVLLCWLCGTDVLAQNSERDVLIDKIVNVSLNQVNRVKMIQLAEEYTEELDPVVAEAVIYAVTQQMVKPITTKSYSHLSEEQLEEVLNFMNSEAYRRLSSNEIATELSVILVVDMLGYLACTIAGESWNPDIPLLSDKEYNALADKYIEQTGALSVFDGMIDPLMESLEKEMGASAVRMMSSMMKQMQKNYPKYYKSILVRFVSKEQLQEAVDFYSQPYMIEVQQNATKYSVSVLNKAMDNPEALTKQMEKYFDNNAGVEDTAAVVRDYIARLPYMPVYTQRIEPIFPVKTLVMKKKATYMGQTRNEQAHGKGVLTDKKGVRYSGDFKEGKRHGLIASYYSNGDSAQYIWADDKVVAEYSKDLGKPASTYKGEAMGYGFKASATSREEGFFIDGSLEGEGKRIELDNGKVSKIEEGWFDYGSLKKGRIINKSNANKIVQFDGEILSDDLINGAIKVGVTRIVENSDGKKIAVLKEGTSINGTMHGMGSYESGQDGFHLYEEGYFAYNELYGKGHRTRKWDKNNTVEVYDGEFFAGKFQGKGTKKYTYTADNNLTYSQITEGYFQEGKLVGDMVYEEKITNIYKITGRHWIFTRFGFEIVFHSTAFNDSLTIHIEGPVTNDKLNGEAEITLSNGDYYKGVFKNGEFKEGVVRKTNSDRSIYEGEMKNGRYEGQGKLTEANGYCDEGTFMYGTCVNGVRKDKRGRVLYKIQ